MVLYELATGKKPIDAMERLAKDMLVPPGEIRKDISQNLNDIIMKAIKLNPSERFQTVEEFERELIRDGEVIRKIRRIVICEMVLMGVSIFLCVI